MNEQGGGGRVDMLLVGQGQNLWGGASCFKLPVMPPSMFCKSSRSLLVAVSTLTPALVTGPAATEPGPAKFGNRDTSM